MSDQSTYERLAERFDKHHTLKKGGPELLYVTGEQVIERLNTVLGFDGWAFEVKDVQILEDEVWALGRMTVYSGERTIVREQAGGQIINRKRGLPATPARAAQDADGDRPAIPAVPAQPAIKGDIIEIANDIKGAVTDCLKKCATLIGVGTYLYDETDRREIETEMAAEKRRPTPIVTPKVNAAAQLTGAPEEHLKTKAELIAELRTGIAYARTLGIEAPDVDCGPLNRAEIEETTEALRGECRAVRAAKRQQAS